MESLFDLPANHEDNLLRVFEEIHDCIYSHDGLSPQETLAEFVKILFVKLYDESHETGGFKAAGARGDMGLGLSALVEMFERTKQEFSEVFDPADKINLSQISLEFIVKMLQNISLSGSSQDVTGLAFQKFLGHHEKTDRGQFFTPEPIIDFCVKIIDPQEHEIILDPACGSGGFLISALRHIRRNNADFDSEEVIRQNLFGIDINKSIARIAKMKLLLERNTENNIFSGNSLDDIKAVTALLRHHAQFDIILTNPPFGAKVHQAALLRSFQLGHKWQKNALGCEKSRDVLNGQSVETLFVERCLELLRIGGRMAIVLPNGNFENSSLEYVRHYITQTANILAVVNLPQETFIPYGTGVKTSLLFLEKKDARCRKEYSVFFGKITKLGYQGNKNGTALYKKDRYGRITLDKEGHGILDEDISYLARSYKDFCSGKDYASANAFSISSNKISGRFDFDFYSPETRSLIQDATNNAVKLGDICEIVKQKSSKLKMDSGVVHYVELSDISTYSFEIINATVYDVHDLPSRASYELKEGDIITAIAGNSVGTRKHATALVSKNYAGCICTNGFRILRNITIDPYYLLFFMRTDKFLKQMFMYRTGAAIPAVSDNDICRIIIDLPGQEEVQVIAEKMKTVLSLREKARDEFDSIFTYTRQPRLL